MKLKTVIQPIEDRATVVGGKEIEITGITANSQAVAPGYLFIAKRGEKQDGNQYAMQAIQAGAHVLLSDIYNPLLKDTVQIIVSDVVAAESAVATQFYGHPSKDLCVIGITGTSGKTTTAYLIRHLLRSVGMPSGLIGTVSYVAGSSEISASRTTPDAICTQKLLRDMVNGNDRACVMEVSSHALDRGRVLGVDFDRAVFTNLSHEHLDYHRSMEEYAKAKKKLFLSLGRGEKKNGMSIMNGQDPYFAYMARDLTHAIYSYGMEDETLSLSSWNVDTSAKCTSFQISHDGKRHDVYSTLLGRFNVVNILAAFGVLLSLGVDLGALIQALPSFNGPPGRLERVQNRLHIPIFVDYAYKEDALRKVLPVLKACTGGRLITVFGCGGDRDREKRPRMARAVEEFSDVAIITSDNPRSEDPMAIVDDAVKGFQSQEYLVEIDRAKAISRAVDMATSHDLILIAGKGHEKTQIFRNTTIPFDDCMVAFQACEARYGSVQE